MPLLRFICKLTFREKIPQSNDSSKKKQLLHINSFSPVGLDGLEPSTSVLSGLRSNQLSYRPGRPNKLITTRCLYSNFYYALLVTLCSAPNKQTKSSLFVRHSNLQTSNKGSNQVIHHRTYSGQCRQQHNMDNSNQNRETHPTPKLQIFSKLKQLHRTQILK